MASRKQLSRQARPARRKASVHGKDFLQKYFCHYLVLLTCPMLIPATLLGQNPSPLASAGYAVLPVPQKVILMGKDIALDGEWQLELEGASKRRTSRSRAEGGLATRFHRSLAAMHSARSESGVIRMALKPNSLSIGQANDRDKAALAEQAYRLTLARKP